MTYDRAVQHAFAADGSKVAVTQDQTSRQSSTQPVTSKSFRLGQPQPMPSSAPGPTTSAPMSFKGAIEPSPDPAVVANPETQEEIDAEAAVAAIDAEIAAFYSMRAQKAREASPFAEAMKDKANPTQFIIGGDFLLLNDPQRAQLAEIENRRLVAVKNLTVLYEARKARIAKWRVEHLDDDAELSGEYVPTDPRFHVVDPPRPPQAPLTETDIKARRKALEIAKKVRQKIDEIAFTNPMNRGRIDNLKGELNELFEKEQQARAEVQTLDFARAARTRAMLAAGELSIEVPAPPLVAKPKR